MTHPPDHLARITPIVGDSLGQVQVAVFGVPQLAPLVRYLAASGVARWAFNRPAPQLTAQLQARHGAVLQWEFSSISRSAPQLVLVWGEPDLGPALELARTHSAALLQLSAVGDVGSLTATFIPPGESPPPKTASSAPNPPPGWLWALTAPLFAGLARAILLQNTPFARPDLESLWAQGLHSLTFHPADPLTPHWHRPGQSPPAPGPNFQPPPKRRGRILVAGLGSLGSVAAQVIAPHSHALLLADPDRVDSYNPVRQIFEVAEVGQSKAEALARRLAAYTQTIAHPHALTDEADIINLIDEFEISAALILTGTAADFELAYACRTRNLPHVVGRCYPRARYWEAIAVPGAEGPGLDDIRGHLALGPLPAPTPEQRRAYSDAGALEAEPATLIESGWAAVWQARLLWELLQPPGLRSAWFLQAQAAERICFLGGVGVEATPHGPAYGIAVPGQVRSLGRGEIRSG